MHELKFIKSHCALREVSPHFSHLECVLMILHFHEQSVLIRITSPTKRVEISSEVQRVLAHFSFLLPSNSVCVSVCLFIHYLVRQSKKQAQAKKSAAENICTKQTPRSIFERNF